MSLILDALRKSDRERRVAAGEPFATTRPLASRSLGVGWWVVAAIGLSVAGAAWWLQDRGSQFLADKAPPGAAESQVQEPAAAGADVSAGTTPALPVAGTVTSVDTGLTPAATDVVANQEKRPANDAAVPSLPSTRDEPTSVQELAAAVDPAAAKMANRRRRAENPNRGASSRNKGQNPAPVEPPPQEFYELPMDVRLQVPALVMNVHVYAQAPTDRFVLINMQRLEEGEEVDGLIARTIRPDGVLMEFQGHQFLLRRP